MLPSTRTNVQSELKKQLEKTTIGDREQHQSLLPPTEFNNISEERTHLKQRLASAFRVFGYLKFDKDVCRSQLLMQAAAYLTLTNHNTALKTRKYNASDLVKWANFSHFLS